MKNIRFNLQAARDFRQWFTHSTAEIPYLLLIQRFALVRLLLLIALFIIALGVVWMLIYLDVEQVELQTNRPLLLDTPAIDELEFWLEERQRERERRIIEAGRTYFQSSAL